MAVKGNRNLKKNEADFIVLFATMTLLAIGLVMVFSASWYMVSSSRGDVYFHLRRQAFWAVLGLGGLIFFSNYSYWKLKRWINLSLLLSVILLLAVFIPGVGMEIYGARRWIGVGGLTAQPSDLAKVSLILFAAAYLSRKDIQIKDFFRGAFPVLAITGLFFLLILRQPDLGTAVAMAAAVMVVVFVAGMPLKQIAAIGAVALPAGFYLMASEPYRLRRLLSFRDPWADPLDTGYQIIQSLYALGPGGLFGVGLGHGRQKMFYLPEPHSDFIFAVIGEELGFIGTASVVILFALLLWRGFKIALMAPDSFGSLLATGITAMIGIQALMNIGVVTGSIPVTGINLPLISAGGSSLLFTMCSIGVLLNISKYTKT
ncbi:stage V sporulation protein E [Dethiobacter alkaliphilus]|uniref:stage V sporulation protein E n=1 Tax=Dethiobacter alkaliphilus TaxID=427926 RepID=UPI002226B605|nr:stage V sporulation protein E [Dethiobacter alkaliphilus]MCW3491235.1 stage V sporulation protein E [Dethiobacter alkaliphilus]